MPAVAADGWQLDTVVAPALLFGTNGIRVAADGSVWIAQVQGNRLSAWSPSSGELRTVAGSRGGLPGPDDVAFGRDGTAYVTQPHAHRVSAVGPGGDIRVLLDDVPEANGVTVAPDGRLFVDECRPDGHLLEVGTDAAGRCRVIRGGIGMANALEMGPDGRLFLPEILSDRVLAVDPDTAESAVALDGVLVPSAVKFDQDGHLVVAESATGRLLCVNAEHGGRDVLASTEPGIDNFSFDGRGGVFVSNFVTGSLRHVDLATGVVREDHPPALLGPCSVSLRPDGRLLVADWLSVVEVAPNGELRHIAQVPLDFRFTVVGAADDGSGTTVLTSDGELWRREGDGAFVAVATGGWRVDALGTSRSRPGGDPAPIAARPGGEVRRIDGGRFGGPVAETDLETVTALAGDGNVVAACDRARGQVALVGAAHRQLWDGFADPTGVAVSAGAVFVAEAGTGRIWRLDADGSGRQIVGRHFAFGGPVHGEALRAGRPSVCADGMGGVLVASDGDGSVHRLRPT